MASEIFKFESVEDDDDDDGPLVYYKLTLWAFGSGELKTCVSEIFNNEHSDNKSWALMKEYYVSNQFQ